MTQRLGGPARWSSLRPEALRLIPPEGAVLSGPVTSLRYLGAGTRVVVRTGGAKVSVLVPTGMPVPDQGPHSGWSSTPPPCT
jgi:putative spermidine/putrescine transport system ATP-binding protein